MTYKNDRALVDDVVKQYLRAVEESWGQSRPGQLNYSGSRTRTPEEAAVSARLVYTILARARIFAIHPVKFGDVYLRADKHTCELAGIQWVSIEQGLGVPPPGEEQEALVDFYEKGTELPFPEPLPFEAVYLGLGSKLLLEGPSLLTRVPIKSEEWGVEKFFLTGFLLGIVGEQPYAYAFVSMHARGEPSRLAIVTVYDERGWLNPQSLDPWVLPMVIQQINDHKTTILEQHHISLSNRMDKKEIEKKGKIKIVLPQPFYTVRLVDALLDDAMKNRPQSPIVREWSHRWDVRGHDVVRIVKGKHPADPKLFEKLKKRGYRVYDTTKPTGEDWERLNRKGVRLAFDEWVAILNYWRESYVKGPEDRPYVPAVRVGSL